MSGMTGQPRFRHACVDHQPCVNTETRVRGVPGAPTLEQVLVLVAQVVRRPRSRNGRRGTRTNEPLSPWMLVAGARRTRSRRPTLDVEASDPARRRTAGSRIVEATVIPAILFFVVVTTIGAGAAMIAVLAGVRRFCGVWRDHPDDSRAGNARTHHQNRGRALHRQHVHVLLSRSRPRWCSRSCSRVRS